MGRPGPKTHYFAAVSACQGDANLVGGGQAVRSCHRRADRPALASWSVRFWFGGRIGSAMVSWRISGHVGGLSVPALSAPAQVEGSGHRPVARARWPRSNWSPGEGRAAWVSLRRSAAGA
jgi:hypothetical protein